MSDTVLGPVREMPVVSDVPDLGALTEDTAVLCDICGTSFPTEARMKTHKYGAFSKHKLPWPGKENAVKATVVKKSHHATPTGKRKDASDMLEGLWGLLSTFVVPMASPAAARGMTFTAPNAGTVLDEVVANTPIDRIAIQPFVGVGAKVSGARDILTIPAMLFMIEQRPAYYLVPSFQKAFRKAVRGQLGTVVAVMKQERALEAQLQQAAVELEMVDDPNTDILDQIIADLVGPILERA